MRTYEEDLDRVKVAVALRTARVVRGWSQSKFAEHMGLSQSSVARMENNESEISFTLMNRIIQKYAESGVDINMSMENLKVTIRPEALKLYKEILNEET